MSQPNEVRRGGGHPTTSRPALPKTSLRKTPLRKRSPQEASPRRPRPAQPWPGGCVLVISLVVVLCLIGLVMILSASSVESLRRYGSPWYFFERQVMWLLLGSVAFVVTFRTDYRRWRRWSAGSMVVALAGLFLVLVPGFGVSVSGSTRWLGVGSWRVQPSEFAKVALILFGADIVDRRVDQGGDWRYTMGPVLAGFGVVALLVMIQPDMGTTMVLAAIALAVLFVGGSPMVPMFGVLGVGATLTLLMAVAAPYRWRRMTSFLHPFADASNTGYQSAQGLVALGSGHFFGLGIGASRASWGYLPNQHTDFIFAIIGEETGLVGALLVMGLFAAFAVAGVRAAARAPDRFGALIAGGITAWIVVQAIINIGAVVGLLPVTGVPLPFVSFGGSSLVITLGAVGILANVAKQGR